jgi:hypothetical protein
MLNFGSQIDRLVIGVLFCAIALLSARAGLAEPRTWTDSSGQHTVRAEFIRCAGDEVVLKTESGREISLPLDKLSQPDQAHVASLRTELSKRAGVRYVNPGTYRIKMGVEITAKSGPLKDMVVSFPVPMDWPEQKVEIVETDVSFYAEKPTHRVISGGVRQYQFRVPSLPAGESAHVLLVLDVERRQIRPPENPELLRYPRKLGFQLRPYLTESPFIETRHPKVRAAAEELEFDPAKPAWPQIEKIYDWTRDKVKHDGTKPLKGALEALMSGTGDCEERTSLFVAMCRLKKIPARSVWIQGHAYPEFYLEDTAGNGHWIPCESLGDRNFGGVDRYDLLLQKGDNFRISQRPDPQRYVSPTASGMLGAGSGQPVLREIREQLK